MKYYLYDYEQNTKKEIKLNAIVNTIRAYININFLFWGIYSSIKLNNNCYNIIDRLNHSLAYKITRE